MADELKPEDLTDVPFSLLSSERQDEATTSASQLGTLDNIALGFKQTALSAAGDVVEDEAPGLIKSTFTDFALGLDLPPELKGSLAIGGLKADANIATAKALAGFRAEGYDPTYYKVDHVEDLTKDLPREYHDDVMAETSLASAQRRRARIITDLEERGVMARQVGGGGARLGGMLLDVDAPLALFSGGSWQALKTAGAGARLAKATGLGAKGQKRAAGLTQGISGGAQAGLAVGLVDEHYRDVTDQLDIIYSTLGGAVFGGVFGTALGPDLGPVRNSFNEAKKDFERQVMTDAPELDNIIDADEFLAQTITPQKGFGVKVTFADDAIDPGIGRSSVGAAQTPKSTLGQEVAFDFKGENVSEAGRELAAHAQRYNDNRDFDYNKEADLEAYWGKIGASKLANIPGGTNFSRTLYTSDAPIMNWLGGAIWESPNGLNSANGTSAVLDAKYQRQIQSQFQGYRHQLREYAKNTDQTTFNTGFGVNNAARKGFAREVMLERNARLYGHASTSNKNVATAADSLDAAALKAHEIGKGRDNELSIDGFEELADNPHYTPQIWDGAYINTIKQTHGKAGIQSIVDGLARGYEDNGILAESATLIARAVVNRALRKNDGVDTSVLSLLQADGQNVLRETLAANNVPEHQINSVVDSLVGASRERSKDGFAKSRTNIDFNIDIVLPDGEAIKVVDLLSQNLDRDWQQYSRKLAGSAALARHGITNRGMREEVIATAQAQQRALGEPVMDANELRAMFSHFDGGAIKGWSSVINGGELEEAGSGVAFLKRGVSLAWLNTQGLTQLGETGAVIAHQGLKNWAVRGPMALLDKELKAGNKELLEDLSYLMGDIGIDHDLFSPHLNLDEVTNAEKLDFITRANNKLNSAVYLQGFLSGFNQVRAMQQKQAALGITDKMFKALKDDTTLLEDGLDSALYKRMRSDFGFDFDDVMSLRDLALDGTVEFKQVGNTTIVNRVNHEQWDVGLADRFGNALTKGVDQQVQRALAGEQDAWMHTMAGSVMTHLKTFPMLAPQKQLVRHFRNNDPEAYAAVGYTLATAMVASMLKAAIDLDNKPMSIEDHAKRAFSYSNVTGFIPMVYDPLVTMMGLEDMRFNQYSRKTDLTPPVLTWAEEAINLPGALAAAVKGDADYGDQRALKSVIYGNLPIMSDAIGAVATRNAD